MADHVLAHGLNTASLRPLAAAAGTSDRMLIYHFGSKDRLIAALLRFLAESMAERLDGALPAVPMPSEAALIRAVAALLRSPPYRPYARLWLDIVSAAAQGRTAQRETGRAILVLYRDWIARRHPQGADGAARALATIEGLLVIDAVDGADIADAALAALPD